MSRRYQVTGECASLTQTTAYGPVKVLLMHGAPIGPGATQAEIDHNVAVGLVTEISALDPSQVTGPAQGGPVTGGAKADAPSGDAPAHDALKADWVTYAVSQGMDRVEADKVTKPELIAALKA